MHRLHYGGRMDDSPIDPQQRVAEAERAAVPWWRASWLVALTNLALAVVALVVVIVVQIGPGTLIDRRGFLTLGAAVVTPFAAVAVVAMGLTTWLVGKRNTTGAAGLTFYGVVVGAVLAQWLLVLLDKNAPSTGWPLLVLSFATGLAAVAAAVVGAATIGRTMRITKARNAIGVRQF